MAVNRSIIFLSLFKTITIMIYNYCTHCYADPDDNYGIDGEIEASNIEEVKHFVEKELELELPLESYWIESEDGSEYYHSPDLITNYPKD